VPTVQFCTLAFPIYARYTDVDMVFGTQIQYLQFLTEFWKNNVFIIALLCINFLTIVYLLVCPKDRNADVEAEIAGLTEERNKQMKGLTAI
jgi:LMBR1 domain-containing protein 1